MPNYMAKMFVPKMLAAKISMAKLPRTVSAVEGVGVKQQPHSWTTGGRVKRYKALEGNSAGPTKNINVSPLGSSHSVSENTPFRNVLTIHTKIYL